MHDCPECNEACYCDGEDHENPTPDDCNHDCDPERNVPDDDYPVHITTTSTTDVITDPNDWDSESVSGRVANAMVDTKSRSRQASGSRARGSTNY